MYEEQLNSRLNFIKNERSRSQSHSSSQGIGNGGLATTDVSDHSSSFENILDDENRRLNRLQQPSRLSTPFNSNRYSQRAVAQFMHERNKARLRRNQKASRMLGMSKFSSKFTPEMTSHLSDNSKYLIKYSYRI